MQPPFELGPIRPPSEAHSLLIRASRNCSWNRCKFCRTYKGQRFELRPVEDIKRDILTVKAIQDKFKEMAGKAGYGTRLSEVAAQVYQSTSDEVVRHGRRVDVCRWHQRLPAGCQHPDYAGQRPGGGHHLLEADFAQHNAGHDLCAVQNRRSALGGGTGAPA